jgi:hypothetical protein
MRRLIDRLNQFGEQTAAPRDARRREIFASPLPPEQELEESEEDD